MIPPLDYRGLLPSGIHSAKWLELLAYFEADVRRTKLLTRAREFALAELKPALPECALFLAGSTFSDKPNPGDIEGFLVVPMSVLADGSSAQAAAVLQADHDRIKAQYEVDFYISWGLPGAPDFTAFFQYVGEKSAAMKHLQIKDKRGIIEVQEWIHG
ncbi:DUF6932 family protein [Paraburkholderia terrae]|uniref:DUF6932 family protein n=1 Tax=Paraburkholderia terrae TaxID=311230 RepID=UPI001EE19B43|nr:hypothetical protein [Paraburkholderia terrae]GJH05007.1 hypothetical protein CBA19C8_30640 [Paraburkholderia terrae]